MVTKLEAGRGDIREALRMRLQARQHGQEDVAAPVVAIIDRVRSQGDAALCELTQQFDHFALSPEQLRLSNGEIEQASHACPHEVRRALEQAARRISDYHDKQLPQDLLYTDAAGTRLGWQWRPIDAVGLYVPGGRASYPSSVLMNAIPARVAGVERLVMTVPTPGGELNPAVLMAARIAGIDEIYRIGGAQAVAALAYGTRQIAAVDKIVGPGNAYVAEAKRQVFGRVGIDSIAGPSEICVVAEADCDPHWIAADLLSQAEHDPAAQSILICDDAAFADAVCAAVDTILSELPRAAIARESWQQHGMIIVLEALADAPEIINEIAPEHLELAVNDPDRLAAKIRHAGAIFLGKYTPEAMGDYIAGPSHVLPTFGTARFSSGLSVYDFIKKSSLIGCSAASAAAIASEAETLAESEGLGAHALSVRLRRS